MNQKQNDFDQWVRRLADEAESPFHEASWLKMEELLDEKKRKKIAWWIWPAGLLSLFISGFFAIYSLFFSNSVSPIDAKNSLSNTNTHIAYTYAIAQTAAKAFDGINNSAIENQDHSIQNLNNKNNFIINNQYESTLLAQKLATHSSKSKKYSTINNTQNQKTRSKEIKSSSLSKDEQNGTNENISSELNNGSTESTMINISQAENLSKSRFEFITYPINNSIQQISYIQKGLSIPKVPNEMTKAITKTPVSSVIISLHGSPEISSVPSRTFGKTSSTWGMSVGYAVSPHISIQTGLNKTTKLYSAEQADYTIESGSYLYGKYIDNIDATCKVIEWPITVGYKFKAFGKNYIQINAGISSTKMIKETYGYDFSYWSGGKLLHRDSTYRFNNWEMWSTAVLNISYIRNISKHLSFSVNPYLKTPLKGIGKGNVDLRSLGGQIGLNYSINTRFKK